MITPQDTRVLVTQDGFDALVASARRKRAKVQEQKKQGGGRMRKSSRTDQAAADIEQAGIDADRIEAALLESVIGDTAVVISGEDQDRVAEGSFVTLCIECDDDKPNQQSTWLLYRSPITVVESHHGVMDPSSDIGRAVLGQPVGSELRVSTPRNGDRAVTIIRSQKPRELPKPKVKP